VLVTYPDVPVAEVTTYAELAVYYRQTASEPLGVALGGFRIRKFDSSGINSLASVGQLNLIQRHYFGPTSFLLEVNNYCLQRFQPSVDSFPLQRNNR
jgi:hypothetical protein